MSATQELFHRLTTLPSNHATGTNLHPQNHYHNELQNIREEGDSSFLFLRTILELTSPSSQTPLSSTLNNTQKEELLFHSLLGFRHVVLFSWKKFHIEFKIICRDYLFALGIHHCYYSTASSNGGAMDAGVGVGKMIGNTCLATAASFWKRGWEEQQQQQNSPKRPEEDHLIQLILSQSTTNVSNKSNTSANANNMIQMQIIHSQKDLFASLESYIQNDITTTNNNNNHSTITTTSRRMIPKSIQASYFLSTILNEFNGSSKVAQYNCSLDFHRIVHLQFEQSSSSISNGGGVGLLDVLRIAMNGLGGIVTKLQQVQQLQQQSQVQSDHLLELGNSIVTLTNDVLSWEFGSSGGHWGISTTSSSSSTSTSTSNTTTNISSSISTTSLVRPPESWREYLIRPDFLGAVFQVYMTLRTPITSTSNSTVNTNNNNNNSNANQEKIQHSLRQLLLLLSSITGIVFEDKNQKLAYCGFLVDGCLSVLSTLSMEWTTAINNNNTKNNQTSTATSSLSSESMEKEIIDFSCMITKLVSNFKVEGLSQLSSFQNLLSGITSIGTLLLEQHVHELRIVHGDIDCVDGYEWRDEALSMLLEAVELLVDDYWLLSIRQGNAQDIATQTMSSTLSPLYNTYIQCRIEMAKMEEYYITANAADLDEVREEIASVRIEEEMTAASSLGRLNVSSSLQCLSTLLLQGCLPRLQALFESSSSSSSSSTSSNDAHDVSPDAAALLEETRLLIVCIGHLLTDECSGEEPTIPERIMNACSSPSIMTTGGGMKRGSNEYSSNTAMISQIVQTLMSLGEFQASKIVINPHNPNLSPYLAKTLVWFFLRFAPAYILPSSCDYDASSSGGGSGGSGSRSADELIPTWSTQQICHQVLSFCMTLSLHYLCYWPHENQVQETSTELLLALAKRDCDVRKLLINTPSMDHLVNLHKLTAMMVHSSNQSINNPNTGMSQDMILGYKRLPYKCRSQLLSVILIASSEINDPKSEAVFNSCLETVQNAFHQLCHGLESSSNMKHDDINAKELVCLCVELYAGVARSSEMTHPERVPIFITPSLFKLSELMTKYASDITICESLLRLFRDYTEQFIIRLDREQSLTVFRASAGLLKQYSTVQCSSRVIRKPTKNSVEEDLEEEQSYNDILCAIQLLLNIGAKEFINTFSNETGLKGIDSNEVTDVIFFGLQQILPLMTQGLLQYPTLCKQYFSLVGFMMDTYPQKVGVLPFDLFSALLDSLLFGMSHAEIEISKSSLEGIAALAREQIESQTLNAHLTQNPSLFENCSVRLLREVVFQSIIWDRLEPTGMALLPLASVDMNRFASVVNTLSQQIEDVEKQKKLHTAFGELMKADVVSKVANGNCGGRQNRLKFKADFEAFVKDVHSSILVF